MKFWQIIQHGYHFYILGCQTFVAKGDTPLSLCLIGCDCGHVNSLTDERAGFHPCDQKIGRLETLLTLQNHATLLIGVKVRKKSRTNVTQSHLQLYNPKSSSFYNLGRELRYDHWIVNFSSHCLSFSTCMSFYPVLLVFVETAWSVMIFLLLLLVCGFLMFI